MSSGRFIVAGAQPWTRKVYENINHILPGEWRYVTNTQELTDVVISRPRWIFVCHWHWLIPQSVWGCIETVNMHAAPLPLFRGGNPIEHQILAGKTSTVITAHRVIAALDAGDVYGTRGPISLAGSKPEILARFVDPVSKLIRWIVETEPQPTPQRGEVVQFTRLSPAAYERLWKERA